MPLRGTFCLPAEALNAVLLAHAGKNTSLFLPYKYREKKRIKEKSGSCWVAPVLITGETLVLQEVKMEALGLVISQWRQPQQQRNTSK